MLGPYSVFSSLRNMFFNMKNLAFWFFWAMPKELVFVSFVDTKETGSVRPHLRPERHPSKHQYLDILVFIDTE